VQVEEEHPLLVQVAMVVVHPLLVQVALAVALVVVENPCLVVEEEEALLGEVKHLEVVISHRFFHHLADSYGSPHLRWGKLYP